MRNSGKIKTALSASAFRPSATVRQAEASGQIRVIGGFYEIGSGAVDFLTEAEDLLP